MKTFSEGDVISFLRPFILVFACMVALAGGSVSGYAQDELALSDARAQGVVGETARGYIAPVGVPSPGVTLLVNRVNAQRRTRYDEVASQNSVPLSEVEVLAAQKIFERLPSGTYVQSSGGWTRKR